MSKSEGDANSRRRGAHPLKLSRPAFAARFPADPALDALVDAFTQGDYARVRREAPALAKSSEDPKVRAAAAALRGRIDADPMIVALVVLTGLLLAALSGWWIAHNHAQGAESVPSVLPTGGGRSR